ncbi:DUF2818 family protein [Niveibacterium sp.]|uniref:DUF2818 family protein n=1 Tax=Niveibacterium sp. TaxID=2017444 RepID=UPI0035AFA0C8
MLGTLVLVCASVLCANLPFISERVFALFPSRRKSLLLRLAEVLGGYLLVGSLAFALERQAHGAAYSQSWEFYVVTAALFVVFAFPGFVYRYLWRKH